MKFQSDHHEEIHHRLHLSDTDESKSVLTGRESRQVEELFNVKLNDLESSNVQILVRQHEEMEDCQNYNP